MRLILLSYYVLDNPQISDAEYDSLFLKLINLEKKYPKWVSPESPSQRVGISPVTAFSTHQHVKNMLSLSNCFNDEEFFSLTIPDSIYIGLIISATKNTYKFIQDKKT